MKASDFNELPSDFSSKSESLNKSQIIATRTDLADFMSSPLSRPSWQFEQESLDFGVRPKTFSSAIDYHEALRTAEIIDTSLIQKSCELSCCGTSTNTISDYRDVLSNQVEEEQNLFKSDSKINSISSHPLETSFPQQQSENKKLYGSCGSKRRRDQSQSSNRPNICLSVHRSRKNESNDEDGTYMSNESHTSKVNPHQYNHTNGGPNSRISDYERRKELNINLDDPNLYFDRFGNVTFRNRSNDARKSRNIFAESGISTKIRRSLSYRKSSSSPRRF